MAPGQGQSIRMKTAQSVDNRESVLLVGVSLKKSPRGRAGDPSAAGRDSLEELHELAESAGAKIAGSILQVREQLDPATLVGRGKLDEIRAEAELRHVPLVVVVHNHQRHGAQFGFRADFIQLAAANERRGIELLANL